MKKGIIFITIIAMMICVVLSGCAETTPDPTKSASADINPTPGFVVEIDPTPDPAEVIIPTPDLRDPLVWDDSYEGKIYNVKYSDDITSTYSWIDVSKKVHEIYDSDFLKIKSVEKDDIPENIEFIFQNDVYQLKNKHESTTCRGVETDRYVSSEGIVVHYSNGRISCIGLLPIHDTVHYGSIKQIDKTNIEQFENTVKSYFEEYLSEYFDFSQFNSFRIVYETHYDKPIIYTITYGNTNNGVRCLPELELSMANYIFDEDDEYLMLAQIKYQFNSLEKYKVTITEDEIEKSILKSITEFFGDDDELVPVDFEVKDTVLWEYNGKPVLLVKTEIYYKGRETNNSIIASSFLTTVMISLEE